MNRRKIAALLIPVLLCLAGCGATAAEPEALPTSGSPGGEEFSVDILSTGKSDCILIRMDGQTILCDTADRDDLDAILALLRDRGVDRIDALVLSHYDKDHIGSAAGLLAAVTVGEIYGPDYVEDSDEYKALAAGVKATGTPWHRLLGEDVSWTTEHGSVLLDPPDVDYEDDNENSLIMVLTWREKKLVFLGDAEKSRSSEFLDRVKTDLTMTDGPWALVKLPHHGDSSGPLKKLLRRTAPFWAVETVSVFEEVESDLLEVLRETGTELYLTRDGAVRITWDGTGFTLEQDR